MNFHEKHVPGADLPRPCWMQEHRPPRGPWYYEALAGLSVVVGALLAAVL